MGKNIKKELFSFPREAGLGVKRKIKQQNGFASGFGRGGCKRPAPSSADFHASATQEFFQFISNNFRWAIYYIPVDIPTKTPTSQYKKRGKIIIHLKFINVKRGGGGTEKMGGLQCGLETGIPLTRNWRSFLPLLYSQNGTLSNADKRAFSHFPYYWFIVSSRVYNHIVVVYWKFVEFHYCIILIAVLYILLTIYEQPVVV